MGKYIDRAKELKIQAEKLITEGNVLKNLKPLGNVRFTGSYALDLMTVEDVDMAVVNPEADLKKNAIEAFNRFADENYFKSYHLYDWIRYDKPEFPTGYYLGLHIPVNNEKWKFDIWFIKELTEYEKEVVPKLKELSQKKRDLILRIKHYRDKNDLEIGSADIYRLVLEDKVKTVKEINNFL